MNDKDLFRISAEINALEKARDKLISEVDLYKQSIDALKAEESQLKEDKESLVKTNRNLTNKVTTHENNLARIHEDCERSKAELIQFKTKEEEAIRLSKEENARRIRELNDKTARADERESELNYREKTINEKEQQIKSDLVSLESKRSSLSEEIDHTRKLNEEARQFNNQSHRSLEESSRIAREATVRLDAVKQEESKITSLNSERERLEKEIKGLHERLAGEDAKLQQDWAEYNNAKASLDAKTKKINEYKDFMKIVLNLMKPNMREDDLKKLSVIEEGVLHG